MKDSWRPIASAHTDPSVLRGDRVLVGWATGQVRVAVLDGIEWRTELAPARPGDRPPNFVCGTAPTHWQPLQPPEA